MHGNLYSLSLVSPPQAEPIDLVEAKLHLKVEHTDDDELIKAMLGAARQQAEAFLNLSLVVQTFDLFLDAFPSDGGYSALKVPRAPLVSVTHVKYTDSAGVVQTLATSKYTVDMRSRPGRIVPAYGESWPTTRDVPNAVDIRFVAGGTTPFTAATNDIVTPKGRTFANGDLVRLTNSGGALPAGLSKDTDYYVVEASGGTFKLSLTSGGAAVDITGTGTGTHYIGALDEKIRAAIRLILGELYEHRSESIEGRAANEVPVTAKRLMWSERILPV